MSEPTPISAELLEELSNAADDALEGAFTDDPEMLEICLDDLSSDLGSEISELEQMIFGYGEALTESEAEDASPTPVATQVRPFDGQKRAVSAGGKRTRVRSKSRPRKQGKRSHTDDPKEEVRIREEAMMSKFKQENESLFAEAMKNRVEINVKMSDLIAKDGRRTTKKFPKLRLGEWLDDSPRSVVSADGKVLLAVFPGYLKEKANGILAGLLTRFGQRIKLRLTQARDAKTRNKLESFERLEKEHELSGVFQLVLLWKAIGRTNTKTEAGVAKDMIKSVVTLNEAAKVLSGLKVLGKRIDDMYRLVDPEQHAFLHRVRDTLREKYPLFNALSTLEETFFHGRSIVFNRATPRHRDRSDPKENMTPIVTSGPYKSGKIHFEDLGLTCAYNSGTLVMVRGSLLLHSVQFEGGQRMAVVHFMHSYMINEAGLGRPPMTDVVTPIKAAEKAAAEKAAKKSST